MRPLRIKIVRVMALAFPVGVDEAAALKYLREHVSADLAHLLQDAGVPIELQCNLTQAFKTVKRFSAYADDRPGRFFLTCLRRSCSGLGDGATCLLRALLERLRGLESSKLEGKNFGPERPTLGRVKNNKRQQRAHCPFTAKGSHVVKRQSFDKLCWLAQTSEKTWTALWKVNSMT